MTVRPTRLITMLAAFAAGLLTALPGVAHTPHDDVFAVQVSPDFDETDIVYVVTRSSVLKSSSAGREWQRMVRGLDSIAMLVHIELGADTDTLFVSSLGNGIFRSSDRGESWENRSLGLPSLNIDRVIAAPNDAGTAIAVSVEGDLALTRNRGESWTAVTGPFSEVLVGAVHLGESGAVEILVGDGTGGLFLSRNGGADWRGLASPAAGTPVTALATAPSEAGEAWANIVFGTQTGAIFLSTDGGESFAEQVTDFEPGTGRITDLEFTSSFAEDGRAYAVHWEHGVACTTRRRDDWRLCSDGVSWDSQAPELGRPSFSDLALTPGHARDGRLFLAAFDGFFHTQNRGGEWEELETFPKRYIIGLDVAPNYTETPRLLMTNMLWGMYETTDGGDTWRSLNTRDLNDYPRGNGFTRLFRPLFSPDFANDGTIFTSTWYAVYKSVDAGASWRHIQPVAEDWWADMRFHGLSINISPNFAEDQTLVAGTNWGKIIRSTDGGESFVKVHEAEDNVATIVFSPDFANDGTVFAGDPYGINRSTDRGETWTFTPLTDPALLGSVPISPHHPEDQREAYEFFLRLERGKSFASRLAVSPDFARDGIVMVGGADGLFRSSDRGATWTRLQGPPFEGRSFIEAVAMSPDIANDGTVLITVRGRGLFRSTDHGQTFAPIAPGLLDQQVQLGHYDGVTPKFPTVVFSPDYADDGTVFGYQGTTFFRSTDRGETWIALDTPEPSFSIRFLTFYLAHLYHRQALILALMALLGVLVVSGGYWWFRRRQGARAMA